MAQPSNLVMSRPACAKPELRFGEGRVVATNLPFAASDKTSREADEVLQMAGVGAERVMCTVAAKFTGLME